MSTREQSSGQLIEVTPDDNTDLTGDTRGVYVGITGNLTVVDVHGNTATFTAVPAGLVLPIRVRRVLATGTTASDIVALL